VRRNPLEGGVSPRARRNPLEGGLEPSSEAEPARGGARLGLSSGPRGAPQRGLYRVCVLRIEMCFVLFFAGFKQDSPGFLGTLRADPDNIQHMQLTKKSYKPPLVVF
jgi:hypothetical protein